MTFTKEQIKALDNPYQELADADTLAKHQGELEQLSSEEKKEVAIKLILNCPESELTQLGYAIKALKASDAATGSFKYTVNQVWEIKKRISALNDPRNTNSYNLLLQPEFNSALFAGYTDFSLNLLKNKEQNIAQKLVNTPEEKRPLVLANMEEIVPNSVLLAETKKIFQSPVKITMHGSSVFHPAAAASTQAEAEEKAQVQPQ